MPASELYIGLMSGTSVDGVDAVLADFATPRPTLRAHVQHAFAPELRDALLQLTAAGADELHRAGIAAQHLARAYAAAVEDLLLHAGVEADEVAAVGAHGQTVRHRPDAGYTWQLNAPATLAELTGIDVVADFRVRDLAAGGQGAPLVPAFHAAFFGGARPLAVVNIGGIANVTGLPGQAAGAVTGFDCGPGNVLLDGWAQRHLGQPMDRDGAWAAGGTVDAALLAALLTEPFLRQAPPKSTGRELFNADWLQRMLATLPRPPAAQDVQTTLTRFTARTIGQAIAAHVPAAVEVVVCGGGGRNRCLIAMLAEEAGGRPLASSEAYGLAPEQVEACAFAWLARAHLLRRAGNLPAVTGARGTRVLGALYPR